MLYTNVKDYDEFKELYVRADGKRKNSCLLSFTASKALRDWYWDRCELERFMGIRSMNDMFKELFYQIRRNGRGRYELKFVDDVYMRSDVFKMDDHEGVCVDGDHNAYRYVRAEDGSVFKKKIGRIARDIILESDFGRLIPNNCLLWLCEELSERWRSHIASRIGQYTLVVDEDFEAIYDTEQYRDECGMGSCMENDGYHTFYNDCVEAYAASLRDHTGAIEARCVIFNKATQIKTGKVMRLAERQYSIDGDQLTKRLLIAKLIEGGYIDAYKPAGASCHEPRSWMGIDGQPLEEVEFKIDCNISSDDYVSYQDSFKWYDKGNHVAYNFRPQETPWVSLETTDGHLEGENYDSWNEEYTDDELHRVFSDGREYWTTESTIDNSFAWVEGREEYHHIDDVIWCACCEVFVLADEAKQHEETGEYYCCQACYDKAVEEYEEEYEEEYANE